MGNASLYFIAATVFGRNMGDCKTGPFKIVQGRGLRGPKMRELTVHRYPFYPIRKPDTAKGSFYANPLYDVPETDEKMIAKYPFFLRPNKWYSLVYYSNRLVQEFKSLI